MANYGPSDQVVDYGKSFTVYDFTTGTYVAFNFQTAGYGADVLLDDYALGAVQIFGVDENGDEITVQQAGVDVPLNGTGSAFAKRAHSNGLTCYFKYNIVPEPNKTYTFTAVFSKTDGINQQSVTWTNNTLQ